MFSGAAARLEGAPREGDVVEVRSAQGEFLAVGHFGERDIADIARSTIFNARPDALCVSGLTAGAETSFQTLEQVKNVAKDTPVFANTGVRENNVQDQLAIADGAIVGTAFKYESVTWNAIEEARVASFMSKVRQFRTK